MFSLDRIPDCVCSSCRAVVFLRKKLSVKDFETLWNLAQSATRLIPPIPLDLSIDKVHGLSRRNVNYLKGNGIFTVGDLVKKTDIELSELPNIGIITMNVIIEVLSLSGRSLAKEPVKTK